MQSSSLVLTILALAYVPCALSDNLSPVITSLDPIEASKEGGTRITVTGAGFKDDPNLQAKFSRLNPDTDQIVEKKTSCTFISQTEVVCVSPEWDEAACSMCDKELYGSTCPQEDNSCADTYPWNQKAVVADVRYDGIIYTADAQPHYVAEDNHHHHSHMTGSKGHEPCRSCANEFDPIDNPNGQHKIGQRIRNGVPTNWVGHTGSPYLRTDDVETDTEINLGQFLKIRNQFFVVKRIERCEGRGCWCEAGDWGVSQLTTNDTAPTHTVHDYPVGVLPSSLNNAAMYEYDKSPEYWDRVNPPTCSGTWAAGTKILLDEAVYRAPGFPNEAFTTTDAYVSNKKPCVDCKCAGGCTTTVAITTDGRTWSGAGTNGKTWTGSAAKFTLKFKVPEVFRISFPGLTGYRDSSRMFVPATGNTIIHVHGKGFQAGPNLRCYFDTMRIMVHAQFIDANTIACQTPQAVARPQDLLAKEIDDNQCADHENITWFAPDISDTTASNRLFDSTCTDSKQSGATVMSVDGTYKEYAYSHIQVTNTGYVRDLSAVRHKRADGSLSYIEDEGSEHRSTCYQLEYPSSVVSPHYIGVDQDDSAVPAGYEQREPCRGSHKSDEPEGNDVQIKFGTCYEAQSSKSGIGTNYYGETALAGEYPNSTHSLGQLFTIPATAQGPLTAVDLHLVKEIVPEDPCHDPVGCAADDRRQTTLEVCISAGGFAGGAERLLSRVDADVLTGDGAPRVFPTADDYSFNTSGHILACEQITIQSIKSTSERYTVFFKKQPYLLGFEQYDTGSSAHYTNADQASYYSSGDNPQTSSAGNNIFDAVYFLTVSWVSGPATVSWAMSDQQYNTDSLSTTYKNPSFATDGVRNKPLESPQTRNSIYGLNNGYKFDWRSNQTIPFGIDHTGFRAQFYTCDGCRWKYVSDADSSSDFYQIGGIYGRQNFSQTYLKTYKSARCTSNMAQVGGRPATHDPYQRTEGMPQTNQAEDPTGSVGDECGTPTYREQLAQAFRPTEDITLTKMKTKMRAAFADTDPTHNGQVNGGANWASNNNPVDHNSRTQNGDFINADGATVSTWITKYGKMGEYVCRSFTGVTQVGQFQLQGDTTDNTDSGWKDNYQTSMSHDAGNDDELINCGLHNKDCFTCDTNNDGIYAELCFQGARCNKTRTDIFGGCGYNGVCDMAEVVSNAHYLRNYPAGNGPTTSRCGLDEDCDNSQGLKVSHSVKFEQAVSATDWKDVVWEFENPVVLDKHTTYYVNMAIDETIANSDSVYWYGGTQAPTDDGEFSRHQFLGAYQRKNVVVNGRMTFVWLTAPDPSGSGNPFFFNLEFFRCVTSLPMISSFAATGAGTGTCLTRSSPRGGIAGPVITVTGKNFFPSSNLRIAFLDEDGMMGPTAECTSTKYDFTEMKCQVPAFDPDANVDCSVTDHCTGVHIVATNDGVNFGAELFRPKYNEPYRDCVAYKSKTGTCGAAVPSSINGSHHDYDHFVQKMGDNIQKHCFSDVHVSVSGSDFDGDGTRSRPFRTLQAGIDRCNENDVILLMPGTYTGTGNRGLRHAGKRIEVRALEEDWTVVNYHSQNSFRDVTVIDCEHYPDGFVLNNNDDSKSPFAGFIDFSDIITKNCENYRVYN
jgi:hypothetical protein